MDEFSVAFPYEYVGFISDKLGWIWFRKYQDLHTINSVNERRTTAHGIKYIAKISTYPLTREALFGTVTTAWILEFLSKWRGIITFICWRMVPDVVVCCGILIWHQLENHPKLSRSPRHLGHICHKMSISSLSLRGGINSSESLTQGYVHLPYATTKDRK